jgi:hypothetical protein
MGLREGPDMYQDPLVVVAPVTAPAPAAQPKRRLLVVGVNVAVAVAIWGMNYGADYRRITPPAPQVEGVQDGPDGIDPLARLDGGARFQLAPPPQVRSTLVAIGTGLDVADVGDVDRFVLLREGLNGFDVDAACTSRQDAYCYGFCVSTIAPDQYLDDVTCSADSAGHSVCYCWGHHVRPQYCAAPVGQHVR